MPELETSVFIVPGEYVKNGEYRLIVLNRVARSVIEEVRGIHPDYVFTYRGNPVRHLINSAWNRARKNGGFLMSERTTASTPTVAGYELREYRSKPERCCLDTRMGISQPITRHRNWRSYWRRPIGSVSKSPALVILKQKVGAG